MWRRAKAHGSSSSSRTGGVGRLPGRSGCRPVAPAAPQHGTDTGKSWLQVKGSPSQGRCLLRPMRSCCGVGCVTRLGEVCGAQGPGPGHTHSLGCRGAAWLTGARRGAGSTSRYISCCQRPSGAGCRCW